MSLSDVKNTKGRILGIDYGEARTGLALSDVSRLLASGIGNIQGGGVSRSAATVAEVVEREKAVAIVLGLPVNMDGSEGPRAARIRQFAEELQKALPHIPLALMDERMSTMAASRFLNETNTRGKKRKGVIDTLSAELILQSALDRLRSM